MVDLQLPAQGWDVPETDAVRFEAKRSVRACVDHVLCGRRGRSLAVVEAERHSTVPGDAAARAEACAQQTGVPARRRPVASVATPAVGRCPTPGEGTGDLVAPVSNGCAAPARRHISSHRRATCGAPLATA
jgi:hypothetical protein